MQAKKNKNPKGFVAEKNNSVEIFILSSYHDREVLCLLNTYSSPGAKALLVN